MHLLSDVRADYENAAVMGLAALQRIPASLPLINNSAYALALAGNYERAKKIVLMAQGQTVHLIATEALIDLLAGHTAEGVAGYRRAYEDAARAGDTKLAFLVWMNGVVALRRAGISSSEIDWYAELPENWSTDPELVLVKRVADVVGAGNESWPQDRQGSQHSH